MPPNQTIAQIALAMPAKPTSGDILTALARAERSGYQRALIEAAAENSAAASELPAILKRQAT